jgi:hypothetical protein
MNHEVTIFFIKMEQIQELEALNASYQERTIKEMMPSWMVPVGASILVVQKSKDLWRTTR